MNSSSANVKSIDVIRQFRVALLEYDHNMRDALSTLLLESRRAQDWVENDRTTYWPNAAREASNRLSEAKNQLEQCQLAARAEDRRSCIDEKKNVQKAKRRVEYCEAKAQAAKRWRTKIRQEAEEFQGGLARLNSHMEIDKPRAVALLERFCLALDKYSAQQPPPSGDGLKQAGKQLNPRD